MKKTKKNYLKIGLLTILLPLVLVGGLAYWHYTNQNRTTANDESIDLDPPTKTDLQETEEHKEKLADQPKPSEETETTPSDNKQVKPQVTSWGQSDANFELAARVPGIFEDGGTCELTLKSGSREVKATSTAARNVSDVSCGFIKIPLSKLTPGKWAATVEYSSETASGISDTKEVTVK
ncbi:MAG: hypothetical protein U5L95_04370 [Candidatus Saccharibacteria bacterium]|nr:hypothetical protein [Candidatus Saccharibacteria bacterium]